MWGKTKNWFKTQYSCVKSLFGLNRDDKLSAEDIEIIQAIANIPIQTLKNINEEINNIVADIENRTECGKEEVGDAVPAVKGKVRRGRKPGKKK